MKPYSIIHIPTFHCFELQRAILHPYSQHYPADTFEQKLFITHEACKVKDKGVEPNGAAPIDLILAWNLE